LRLGVGLSVRKLLIAIAICLLPLIGMARVAQASSMVVKFYDGDNITVIQEGIKTKVSLACIDAPELKQAFGNSARKALKSMVGNSEFSMRVFAKDRFGRLIAEVFANDINVNKALVMQGLAHFRSSYKNGCEGYAEAEQLAQKQRLGMWQDGIDIESPQQFRQATY
jgi:micrococcal nuclease